eukprot:scaffold332_cov117-Cylindrotheca_fusiformis.AAC.22
MTAPPTAMPIIAPVDKTGSSSSEEGELGLGPGAGVGGDVPGRSATTIPSRSLKVAPPLAFRSVTNC